MFFLILSNERPLPRLQRAPIIELSAVVNDCLLRFYEHKLRERIAVLPPLDIQAPARRRKLQSGTVTVVQRTSSDLRLNPSIPTSTSSRSTASSPNKRTAHRPSLSYPS